MTRTVTTGIGNRLRETDDVYSIVSDDDLVVVVVAAAAMEMIYFQLIS